LKDGSGVPEARLETVKTEIMRCLERYIAREVFPLLVT
jgi:hypothetical protein